MVNLLACFWQKLARARGGRLHLMPVEHDAIVGYKIEGIEVKLPHWHLLPKLRKQHVNYDRFIPILTQQLVSGDVVVDVGANCGDTLAGMVSRNHVCSYICIEPDNLFFDLLCENASEMRKAYVFLSVIVVQALVGDSVRSATLEGVGGTKHAAPAKSGSISSQKLDSLLNDLEATNVRLIKVDTDGYDFDVIDSASETIMRFSPILFFECASSSKEQCSGFKASITSLAARGYTEWSAFDNFGGLIVRSVSHCIILQLIDYVEEQNKSRTTRTIYYIDVVASKKADADLISIAIDLFLTEGQ